MNHLAVLATDEVGGHPKPVQKRPLVLVFAGEDEDRSTTGGHKDFVSPDTAVGSSGAVESAQSRAEFSPA